jgi:putative oxidoreductase
MVCVKHLAKAAYLAEIRVLDYLKHPFLLILRLYFGWGFMSAGLGKLLNIETHTGFFRDWGIPAPMLNVYLAGTTETVGGFLLLIGLASRIITIPLIGTMLVAYLTAHTEQLYALWGNTPLFFKAPPFPYLFTCVVVLLFGPGLLSIDGIIKWLLARRKTGSLAAESDDAYGSRLAVRGGDIDPTFSSRGQKCTT